MKTANLKRVYPILVIFALLFVFSCEKEELNQEAGLETIDAKSKIQRKKPRAKRVRVCHRGESFRVGRRVARFLMRRGAAVDWDGDGFFHIPNPCGEVDCDDRDPEVGICPGGGETSALLIGTWTSSEIEIVNSVGPQSLTDYLVAAEGFTPTEAEAFNDALIASLEPEVIGSLTLNADNTYASDFIGGSDTGTWELNADETVLTLFEGPDTIVVTINSISETSWDASLGDDFPVDVDEDPSTPDVVVTVLANLVLLKE